MLKLVKPSLEHKEAYKEMIEEWQQYEGPYVPCIIDYDCNNPVDKLDYDATLQVVEDYRNGKIFDYDIDYFECADFYFLFDENDLIGMGEVRHNLKPLGINTLGHIACGIRPLKRKKGYAREFVSLMIESLKEDDLEEVIICHYAENHITPKIIKTLNFEYRNSIVSKVSKKEIKCYTKKLK